MDMIFLHTPASEKSSAFIDHYIYFKHFTPDHTRERVVPDGTINIIFEMDGKTRSIYDNETLEIRQKNNAVWVTGIKNEFITISAHQDSEMLVARLKLGRGYQVLGSSLKQVEDNIIHAKEIFGDDVLDLRKELLTLGTGEEKISRLEEWLCSIRDDSLQIPPSVDEAIELMLEDPFLKDGLERVITTSRFSKKQFIYHFKKHVGTAPKNFQKILRFNEVLKKIHNKSKVDWMEVIHSCGYFDQAHFIKDFSKFSGVNPGGYIREFKEHLNFFPLDKER